MLIVLSGLPGTGKTTIARRLAVSVCAVHLRIDTIEHALGTAGMRVGDEGYRVAYALAEDLLGAGHRVIADCVNPWPATREAWRAVGERARVPVLDVEIVCSDRDEHRRRVDDRSSASAEPGLPTWADVCARDYHPWGSDPLVVDTSALDVDESVQRIASAVRAIDGGLTR